MKNDIIKKLTTSKLFIKNKNIFIQNEDTISMYSINKKEKEAMDKIVHCKKKQFNPLQEYYNNYSHNKIVEKNIEIIQTQSMGSVAIDCGCGKGEYLEALASKFEVVIAIDLSLEAIADFCLSAEVIEHVPSPDEYLKNIFSLLKKEGKVLISTPCQNLYFYPMQFISMLLTKPKILYKLLSPLKYWYFALDWHPAMSKKVFLNLLKSHDFKVLYYQIFVPYYFDKLPIVFYIAKILPQKYSLAFYQKFLVSYNLFIEKIGFGIRQHSLLVK